MKFFKHILLFSFILFFVKSNADIPDKPKVPHLVNDFSDILSKNEEIKLEKKLLAFNDSTSTQIVIVTVNDFDDYDISQYAFELGEKWGVGQKGFDNGIVILIKAKGAKGKRQAFIAVGYGLEGVIPDITAKRIVENEMIPEFKKGRFFAGLDKATTVLMKLSSGEFKAKDYNKKTKKSFFPLIIVLFIFILMLVLSFQKRKNIIYSSSGSSDIPFWLALFLASYTGTRTGKYNDFVSGSGTFGDWDSGISSGGFGGFGGGSFGGGGAGGSW